MRIRSLFLLPWLLAACPACAQLLYVIPLETGSGDSAFVEVTLPPGANAGSISHGGTLDPNGEVLRWGPLSAAVTAVFFELGATGGTLSVNVSPNDRLSVAVLDVAADSDADGISDDYEAQNGLSIGVNDATLDADRDGFSNLIESLIGTRADDPTDRINVDFKTVQGKLRFEVMERIRDLPFVVETTTELDGDFWRVVNASRRSEDGVLILEIPDEPGPAQFFRIRLSQ